MIIKTPISKEEKKEFKKQYTNRKIKTEVIDNLLQSFYKNEHPELKEFLKFKSIIKTDNDPIYSEYQNLISFMNKSSNSLLNDRFGKYDFLFISNKIHKIYLLDFKDLTFMVSNHKEFVLLEDKKLSNYIPKLIAFEKEFNNLLLQDITKNINQIPTSIQKNISNLKLKGFITEQNNINYNYFKKENTIKFQI